jgi:2-polyprenyl-3-methyl-5-hydroxy-6-metoxy-1,4-benzoquinol methylase
MPATCTICDGTATSRPVTVRSGKQMTLWHCAPCHFDFFTHDPTRNLEANRLDESRLKAAGLDVPDVARDFANGTAQSRSYIEEYLDASDVGHNLLEIGCSWGYFLKLARDAGANAYGVELNSIRTRYVNDQLKIPCDDSLDTCEARGIRFRKIFLFYVLEYVPDPVKYLRRLIDLLDEDGVLVAVTPNLDDPLKDLWRNDGFRRFFYDEHAVNYMTPRAVGRMLARLTTEKTEVSTRQGYSVVNHVSWFLTNAPRTTGVVGGDNFVRDIMALLRPDAGLDSSDRDEARRALACRLGTLLGAFDVEYRRLLEEYDYGNQIRMLVRK